VPNEKLKLNFTTSFYLSHANMPHLTPKQKHDILKLYSPYDRNNSFESLAHQYNIKGGSQVLQNWYRQWNGQPKSLERQRGSGRQKLLTSKQVKDLIQIPIRNKNRASVPVHYPEIQSSVIEKTGKTISLRTIQRIGHDQIGAKQKNE
jgi:transposase